MPRAQTADLLHGFKFRASIKGGQEAVQNWFGTGAGEAGFNSITTPETTLESVEYREGMYSYSRKEPGLPTVADVTFSRGVVLGNTDMFHWVQRTIEGGPYRASVTYFHYHRLALPGAASIIPGTAASGPYTTGVGDGHDMKDAKANIYNLYEAFPIRVKAAGDLDATGSDISLQEMDVAYEHWDMAGTEPPAA